MKASQRRTFRRLVAALNVARKNGYKPTHGDLFIRRHGFVSESGSWENVPYACAYGAMAIGLGLSEQTVRNASVTLIAAKMAETLGADPDCLLTLYKPVYIANDNAPISDADSAAIRNLENFLESHPEVC